MKRDIWFDDRRRSLSPMYWSLFFGSRVIAELPRPIGVEVGKQFLLNPRSRRDYKFTVQEPSRSVAVPTEVGNVVLHHFAGEGPTLLLVHGWGDTSYRFSAMIKELCGLGYNVYAFDQIGHGKSEGDVSHLFGFIKGLEAVMTHIEQQDSIHGVVAHSMGTLSLLNLSSEMLQGRRVVLVAPPIEYFGDMFVKIRQAGVSKKMLMHILEHYSRRHGIPWQNLEPVHHRAKLHSGIFVVHDQQDRICPYMNSRQFFASTPVTFHSTDGLGHHRVLRDRDVFAMIVKHMGVVVKP
ncbi:MAG: hypothetical protein CL675_05180 [Bdellovibrionaceae bacterium]|nr:hypothetical protein [Pseudobdellovibrionaceae bacterium]